MGYFPLFIRTLQDKLPPPEPRVNAVLISAADRRPKHRPRVLSRHPGPLPGWLQAVVLLLFLSNGFQPPYDGLNRNTKITDPASQVTTLTYDGLNKTGRVDADRQSTAYLYDKRNRLQHVIYGSALAANSKRDYAYDAHGNLLSVTEPARTAAK